MFKLYPENDCTVLEAQVKTLEAANAQAFKTEAKTALEGLGPVVIDLRAVEFIDSSGIGTLLSLLKVRGGELRLRAVQGGVMSVLELLRLHRVFQIEPS